MFEGFGRKPKSVNDYGCRKCKYDKVCFYCGLDLTGYRKEHFEKGLTPYDVIILNIKEQYDYTPETKLIRVPVRFAEEFEETVEAYYISTMSDHLKGLNVKHKVFVLYPSHEDFETRKEMSINYVHRMLGEIGYTTHKHHYKTGYNAGAGKECIEVLVFGDFENVESFIGNI